jgi:hypothetical protein
LTLLGNGVNDDLERRVTILRAKGIGFNVTHDFLQSAPNRAEILEVFFPQKPGAIGAASVFTPALH